MIKNGEKNKGSVNVKLNERLRFVVELSQQELEVNGELEVEVLTTAKQTDWRYGDFQYTKAQLEEMADHFNNDVVGTEIAVDLNHDPEHIALAWLKPKSMRVAPSNRLKGQYSAYVTVYQFTPAGYNLVITRAVRYFSVEIQMQLEKFAGKVKKIYKNVLRGLALTNRPVIKDMMPTFSESQSNLFHNSNSMNTFKIYLSSLSSKKVVSKNEKNTLNEMFQSLSEDEQAEVQEAVDGVSEKPETEPAAPVAPKEGGEGQDGQQLAEQKNEIKALNEKLTKTQAELSRATETLLSEQIDKTVASITLADESNETSVGIKSDEETQTTVKDFLRSLNEEQRKTFASIIKEVQSVDFNEYGHDKGRKPKNLSDSSKDYDEQVAELAEKKMKDAKEKGVELSLTDAQDLAMEELN